MPSQAPWAPGSPLFFDGPWVPPAGEHPESFYFYLFELENNCQKDCKISSKIESKWLHENVKYDKKSQNGLEKGTSRKHAQKIHENQENTCLESLIFMSILVRNRSFHFSRFVQINSKIAPIGSRNWGLHVFFSPKTWPERGVKNTQKTITGKVRTNYKKVVKKDVP